MFGNAQFWVTIFGDAQFRMTMWGNAQLWMASVGIFILLGSLFQYGILVPPLMSQAMPLAWSRQLKCTCFAVHGGDFLRDELMNINPHALPHAQGCLKT